MSGEGKPATWQVIVTCPSEDSLRTSMITGLPKNTQAVWVVWNYFMMFYSSPFCCLFVTFVLIWSVQFIFLGFKDIWRHKNLTIQNGIFNQGYRGKRCTHTHEPTHVYTNTQKYTNTHKNTCACAHTHTHKIKFTYSYTISFQNNACL